MIEVIAGGLALLQDHGRPGYAHLGVPRAGALDPAAADLANRLVGNPTGTAVLEVVGGITLTSDRGLWIAVTGAPATLRIDGIARRHTGAEWLPAGGRLALGPATSGLRCWLAVGGGFAAPPVLGSRSTDTLAWLGPPPVGAGTRLDVGEHAGRPAPLDVPPARRPYGALRVLPGPTHHAALFAGDPHAALAGLWRVSPDSNRVGIRLARDGGPGVGRLDGELPSEATVLGAIQVPPSGDPIVLLHDHGPTGGYPVAGVVHPDDLWQWAQAAPGDEVSFRSVRAQSR